ncbi:MAG: hypothetical protein DDT35_01534 [Firmicutes bacterium]|nr:hypothetical protein [Bacillota bacterium]
MRRLLNDKRGEAMFLALLFLMFVAVLFLQGTYQISTAVARRSQLARLCDEVAVNVSVAGLDRQERAQGRHVIDQYLARAIATQTFVRAGIEAVDFTIELINGEVVVRATVDGIVSTGVATPRKLQN